MVSRGNLNRLLLLTVISSNLKKSNQTKITKRNCAITAITHDSNDDVPEAQHTTGDVEDSDVFLVVVEKDDAEILDDILSII